MCHDLLSNERLKLARYSSDGRPLDYSDRSDIGIDHMESARDFLQSIEDFVSRKAHELSAVRTKMGLPDGLDGEELALWEHGSSQLQSRHCPSVQVQTLIKPSELSQSCH